MFRFGALAFCLVVSITFSQNVSIVANDVEIETDEFTSEVSCSQMVSLPGHPDYLTFGMRKSGDLYSIDIVRFDLDADKVAFNLYGALEGDKVLMKFSDGTVQTFEEIASQADTDSSYDWFEIVSIPLLENEVKNFLSQQADIRFRLDGSNSQIDDTLPTEVLKTLAEGFQKACME
jgi:hypothetical protein